MKKRILALLLTLVLCMGLCIPASAASTPFTDVPAGSAFEEAIAFAVERGITQGTTATTFSPGNPCTISHILTFIVRHFNDGPSDASEERSLVHDLAGILHDEFNVPIDPENLNMTCTRLIAVRIFAALGASGSVDTASAQAFTDLTSDEASQQAIAFAVDTGITKGTSATAFSPDNPCTRGQIVTFLFRALNAGVI